MFVASMSEKVLAQSTTKSSYIFTGQAVEAMAHTLSSSSIVRLVVIMVSAY